MAKIGQPLIVPETGWKRFDDISENIEYIGRWNENKNGSNYGETFQYSTQNGSIRFNFTGTKIRLIAYVSALYDPSISITIDETVTESFSQNFPQASWMVLVYEKTGLENKEHSVLIESKTIGKYINLDAIDIDTSGEIKPYKEPANNKILISSGEKYYYHDQQRWQPVSNTEQDYLDYGMNPEDISAIPTSAWQELPNPTILYYTDDLDKNEITIETETEPFTIYDEMGDSMEVLYYTDDPNKEEVKLDIIANYSPLDELDGDFEVVTWTDEEDSERILKLSGLPVPQFISKTSPENINGYLQGINVLNTDGESKGDMYRILISPDKSTWKTWDGSAFADIDTSDNEIIKNQGIKLEDLLAITVRDWEKWNYKQFYIGVFIDDTKSDNQLIDTINIKELSPTESTKVSDAKLYILNTTSTIDVTFAGSTVTGHIDDADLGKVQYRVLLNGEPYFPKDGSFTNLQPSPLNISVTFSNNEILIDQNNNLRIEFQDYWGSTDFWETNFVGTYSGLMFIDPSGNYYSTDIGEILQYLDFGVIIAGQTTLGQKVTLRNTYGYPVENIKITANTENFPIGMKAQFSKSEADFEALDELSFDEILENGEEKEFFVRLTTQLGVTPNTQGQFDILVTANRVI